MGGLLAQSYEPYGPLDPEWRQGRHDYKKTAKAPWRCSTPATVAKTRSREDDNNANLYVTTARKDGDDTTDIFYTGEDRGWMAGGPNTWLDGADIGRALCDNQIWPDYGTGECVLTTNGVGFCPAAEEPDWPWDDWEAYIVKIDFNCNESFRHGFGEDDDEDERSNMTIIDIDGDGIAEIYWVQDRDLYMFRENIGSWSYSWRASLPDEGGDPVIGDFNGDGNWEVCVPLQNNTVRCYNAATGTLLWTGSAPCGFNGTLIGNEEGWYSAMSSALMAWDLDGDGADELVVRGGSCVAAYDVPTWTPLWTVSAPSNRAGAMGDLDGDGLYDVVVNNVSGTSGNVTVIDGQSGSIIATFTESTEGCSAPTVADIDADGIWDVVLACVQPVAWSSANGWAGRVWTGSGTAPYSITSDLIVSRLTSSSLQLVFGDASCFVSQWVCNAAIYGNGDQDLGTEEKPVAAQSFSIRVEDGSVVVEGYRGEVEIYRSGGNLVRRVRSDGKVRINLKPGTYLIKAGSYTESVIVR